MTTDPPSPSEPVEAGIDELWTLSCMLMAMPRNAYGDEHYLAVEAALQDVQAEINRMTLERVQ